MNLIRISTSDDFVVDYDKDRGMYRVSVFEDCHYKDEYWFDAYEEKEVRANDDFGFNVYTNKPFVINPATCEHD
jgi:hypothetical protein